MRAAATPVSLRCGPNHAEVAIALDLSPLEQLKPKVLPKSLSIEVVLIDLQHERHIGRG